MDLGSQYLDSKPTKSSLKNTNNLSATKLGAFSITYTTHLRAVSQTLGTTHRTFHISLDSGNINLIGCVV